jgi:hypothetical protein
MLTINESVETFNISLFVKSLPQLKIDHMWNKLLRVGCELIKSNDHNRIANSDQYRKSYKKKEQSKRKTVIPEHTKSEIWWRACPDERSIPS